MEHDLEKFYVADHVKLFAGFHSNAMRRVVTALPSLRLIGAKPDPNVLQYGIHGIALMHAIKSADVLAQRIFLFLR